MNYGRSMVRYRPADEFQTGGHEIVVGEESNVYGWDEILGDDDYEMVGARGRGRARATVRKSAPTSARDLYLGLSQTGFTASVATQNATATPQVTFRPDRIVIGDSIAANFQLNSLFIGNRLQAVSSGPVGMEIFSNKSVGVRLKLDTAVIGLQIVAGVTYLGTSTAAVTFLASLIGPAVY